MLPLKYQAQLTPTNIRNSTTVVRVTGSNLPVLGFCGGDGGGGDTAISDFFANSSPQVVGGCGGNGEISSIVERKSGQNDESE
jgi:hypothetical protein